LSRRPAAPAPTDLSSSRSWTNCGPATPWSSAKLDRLGRSLRHLVDTITGLAERGIGLRSLQEAIDTTTPGGKLVFHVFAALAELERDLIRERTTAGLAAARARGRHGGRASVLTAQKLQVAQEMYRSGEYTVAAIATTLGVSRASIYRHLETSR
jgi:DNA invertase Pin-like site-specific DNA recombinase